jgi:glycosidase
MATFARTLIASCVMSIGLLGCAPLEQQQASETMPTMDVNGKPVVYQIFTRLFGNTKTANIPWGTIEQNGVGKFSDITSTALHELRDLGVTHVWYTGVPHHALVGDYTAIGISHDDPDVVKGRAGSPYAVKDYYSVNPDLADDPAKRLEEFDALIKRTHAAGLKVVIDIVPNHVARNYESLAKPLGVRDFGADDDATYEYKKDNNFYYVVGEPFRVPTGAPTPLGGEAHPLVDDSFNESPAKWTGNGSRLAQPDANDWYETIKVNYGVRPNGTHDFASLPRDFAQRDYREHAAFWADKDVPNSWVKFREIAEYWLARGVDGFRFDMAEMVPVEFWSYLNSAIKSKNPDAFLLAEIYNQAIYADYIQLGKMDYLYDKVDLYDSLKDIIQGRVTTDVIDEVQARLAPVDSHLLRFLENHDEQRIAHPEFAGSAEKAKPAMVVTALIGKGPSMIYFGQEVGEPAFEDAGFGKPSRTSIFDYIGVPHHQRWMNEGSFDGGGLSTSEKSLRAFYGNLLRLSRDESVFNGDFIGVHQYNRQHAKTYPKAIYSFVRAQGDKHVLVVTNFSEDSAQVDVRVPKASLVLENSVKLRELLVDSSQVQSYELAANGDLVVKTIMGAYGSAVLAIDQ